MRPTKRRSNTGGSRSKYISLRRDPHVSHEGSELLQPQASFGAAERQDARLQRLYSPAVIQRLLKRHGLRPNKALGQNFLADLTPSSGSSARLRLPDDVVLEIGPGLGSLTEALLGSGRPGHRHRKGRRPCQCPAGALCLCPNVVIVHGDALGSILADLVHPPTGRSSLQDDAPSHLPGKVVANLPYYITSPLLMHLLEGDLPLHAPWSWSSGKWRRGSSPAPGTKEYGALTVAVQYRALVRAGSGSVPPTVFVPPPAVVVGDRPLKPARASRWSDPRFFLGQSGLWPAEKDPAKRLAAAGALASADRSGFDSGPASPESGGERPFRWTSLLFESSHRRACRMI